MNLSYRGNVCLNTYEIFPSLVHHKVQLLCSLFPAGVVNLVTLSKKAVI